MTSNTHDSSVEISVLLWKAFGEAARLTPDLLPDVSSLTAEDLAEHLERLASHDPWLTRTANRAALAEIVAELRSGGLAAPFTFPAVLGPNWEVIYAKVLALFATMDSANPNAAIEWLLAAAAAMSGHQILENPTLASLRGGLAPADDERVEFERVWQLMELAIESGRLDQVSETELRTLRQILDTTRANLDPERHDDLLDIVTNKLLELLPHVVRAIVPDIDLPESVKRAGEHTDDIAQLEALARDVNAAADTYEVLAAELGETIAPGTVREGRDNPLFPAAVAWLDHGFARTDASIAALRRSKTGRATLGGLAAAARATAAATLTAVTTTAIPPLVAAVVAATSGWIYTLIRRRHPELPARNTQDAPPSTPTAPDSR